MDKPKVRTFVFVTDLPESVTDDAQLLNELRGQANEVMATMIRGTYALVLFGSEEAALDACKSEITVESSKLKLRAVRREKAMIVEETFQRTIMVEGQEVNKDDIAKTRGYEDALRGLAPAKWCTCTRMQTNCPRGIACRFLHLKAYQKTVEPVKETTQVEAATIALSTLPAELVVAHTTVPVTVDFARGLDSDENGPLEDKIAAAAKALGISDGFFITLEEPHRAPTDAFFEHEEGLAKLKKACPLPANGAPTPLERDRYIAEVLQNVNQLSRCRSGDDASALIRNSERMMTRIRDWAAGSREAPLNFVVMKWLPIAGLFSEVKVIVKGGQIMNSAQRVDDVLSMDCLEASTSPAENAASEAAEKALGKLEGVLQKEGVTADFCLKVVIGEGGEPVIVGAEIIDSVIQRSSLDLKTASDTPLTPVWRRVKYARVPRFTRELLIAIGA